MDRSSVIGLLILGGVIAAMVFLAHKDPGWAQVTRIQGSNGIRFVPVSAEAPRYRNKETRNIEYNADGLPTKIEIIRDFTIA